MASVTLKQIRAELEKFKTLDEKKQYLESILKKTKSPKLKTKIEKLLAEVSKHIEEHETKLTRETPLEDKLIPLKEASEEITSGRPLPEIKYFSRRGQGEQSALENEVISQPMWGAPAPVVGIKYAPPSMAYEHQQRVENLRFYLSEQQQLVERFTPGAWQAMPDERKRQIKEIVTQSLGLTEISSVETNHVVDTYISDIFSPGKPSEKYKTRT